MYPLPLLLLLLLCSAVTRTIGNSDCKKCVSCEPFMSEPVTPAAGGAVVLCSDGVWDNMRPEEVSKLLLKRHYDGPSRAAEKIVKKVVRKGLTDDTTAVVLLFGPAPGSESGDSSNGSDSLGRAPSAAGETFLRRLGSSATSSIAKEKDSGSSATSSLDGTGEDAGYIPPGMLSSVKERSNEHLTDNADDITTAREVDPRDLVLDVIGACRSDARCVVEYKDLDPAMEYLGHGEFATAWRTKLHGEPVAIKMIKKDKLGQGVIAGFKREIMLMTHMGHANVLPGLAVGQLEGKSFMVLKILNSVLINDLPRPSDSVPFWVRWRETKRWPLSRAMRYAIQLGSALRYCHHEAFPQFRVLHRDIKPANIGFLHDGTLVLFDFGLAALWTLQTGTASDAPRPLTGDTGSLRYMAPEVATNQPYNHKADVFSFADVFWEMLALRKPFENFTPNDFIRAITQGLTPEIKKKWPPPLQRLLAECFSLDMNARPDFRQIVPRLEAIHSEQIAAEKPRSKKSKQPLQLHSPRSNSISNTPATAETACSARDFAC